MVERVAGCLGACGLLGRVSFYKKSPGRPGEIVCSQVKEKDLRSGGGRHSVMMGVSVYRAVHQAASLSPAVWYVNILGIKEKGYENRTIMIVAF